MPTPPAPVLLRRLAAELLGSALLAAIVLGSGVMASKLSDDVGIQLLGNAWATALGLGVLILVLAPVSGAYLNPVVSIADSILGFRAWRDTIAYLPVQIAGCVAGAVLANAMFGLPAVSWSTTERAEPSALLSEIVATAGLVLVIFALARTGRGALAAPAVGAYIGAACFFTSSTSFANPAITIGRMFSDSFAGISPGSAPWFVLAQLVGTGVGLALVCALFPAARPRPASR